MVILLSPEQRLTRYRNANSNRRHLTTTDPNPTSQDQPKIHVNSICPETRRVRVRFSRHLSVRTCGEALVIRYTFSASCTASLPLVTWENSREVYCRKLTHGQARGINELRLRFDAGLQHGVVVSRRNHRVRQLPEVHLQKRRHLVHVVNLKHKRGINISKNSCKPTPLIPYHAILKSC